MGVIISHHPRERREHIRDITARNEFTPHYEYIRDVSPAVIREALSEFTPPEASVAFAIANPIIDTVPIIGSTASEVESSIHTDVIQPTAIATPVLSAVTMVERTVTEVATIDPSTIVPELTRYLRYPQEISSCPHCHQMPARTRVKTHPSLETWIACCACLACHGCWWCPFIIDGCKKTEHSCTQCGCIVKEVGFMEELISGDPIMLLCPPP